MNFEDLPYRIILDILTFKSFQIKKETEKYDLIGYFKHDIQRNIFQIFSGICRFETPTKEVYYFKDKLKWLYSGFPLDFDGYKNLKRLSFSNKTFKLYTVLEFTEKLFPKLRILDVADERIVLKIKLPLRKLFWYGAIQYNLNISELPNSLEKVEISFKEEDIILNQKFFENIKNIKSLYLTNYNRKIFMENNIKLNNLIKIEIRSHNNVSNLINNCPNIQKLKLCDAEFNHFDHYENLIHLYISCIKYNKPIFSKYSNHNLRKLKIGGTHDKEFYEGWGDFKNLEYLSIGVQGIEDQIDEIPTLDIFKTYLFKNLKFLGLCCKINIMGDGRNFEKLKGIYFSNFVLSVEKFFQTFELKNVSIVYLQKLKLITGKNWKLKNIEDFVVNDIDRIELIKYYPKIKDPDYYYISPLDKHYKKYLLNKIK